MREFLGVVRADAQAFGRTGLSAPFLLAAILGLNKFSAVLLHRIASALFDKGLPLRILAKVATRWNGLCNNCEVSPQAQIGPGLHIPHPIGIVVGAVRAGANLTIMQNASLALKDRSLPNDDPAHYPRLGDGVTVGPGAAVLGGIAVGSGALIGANAVILHDVPPGSRAVGNPARILPPRQGPASATAGS